VFNNGWINCDSGNEFGCTHMNDQTGIQPYTVDAVSLLCLLNISENEVIRSVGRIGTKIK